jgi:hypothetical protein
LGRVFKEQGKREKGMERRREWGKLIK